MRLLRFFIALVCLGAGAVVGALNRVPVRVDLAFTSVPTNLGIALILAVLLGVLLGGLAISASVVMPLRRRLCRVERESVATSTSPEA